MLNIWLKKNLFSELPQDDNHPFVIKNLDELQIENNSVGFELFKAMKIFEDNIAQVNIWIW